MKYDRKNETLVSVQNLSCHFQGKTVLDSVSLNVIRASTLAVVGPGSSGKSTLLSIIASELPKELEIVKGQVVRVTKRLKISYWKQHEPLISKDPDVLISRKKVVLCEVFSHYTHKYPQLKSVMQNVTKKDLLECEKWVKNIANLLMFLENSALSDILLLDEPENGLLDHLDLLIDILEQYRNRAVVIVSHNVEFIKGIADRVMYLSYGQTITQCGKTDFFASKDSRIQYLIKMGV